MNIIPANSLLANSSPEILKPKVGKAGTFEIVWIPTIDAHALFYTKNEKDAASSLVATHHNAYSLNEIVIRCFAGDYARTYQQVEYVQDCGGTACNLSKIGYLIEVNRP